MNKIKEIFKKLYPEESELIVELNRLYFESLYLKSQLTSETSSLILRDDSNNSNVIPLPIASEEDLSYISVQNYSDLEDEDLDVLKRTGLCLSKMQAGLGTSVRREDLIKKYDNREKLGSKGTDLFIKVEGKYISLAERQLQLAIEASSKNVLKYVAFVNLVNSETKCEVDRIWRRKYKDSLKSYKELFSQESLFKYADIDQLMVPTLCSENELSTERIAPAGHAFIGFFEILKLFRQDKSEVKDEIYAIGNGEDISSNPDFKIISWMAKKDIPVSMLTTTKQEKDKKGGQIAIVRDEKPYVTIVEKAQAEKANQLEYFESLGLRGDDRESLFNTNIVLINKKALKKKLDSLNISESEFMKILAPDLIKNVKEQNGKSFTQLEGALGSTLLNLDKFYRQRKGEELISFLNLGVAERTKFFMPIKKREDFDSIFNI